MITYQSPDLRAREFHEPGLCFLPAQFSRGFVVSANLRSTCWQLRSENNDGLEESPQKDCEAPGSRDSPHVRIATSLHQSSPDFALTKRCSAALAVKNARTRREALWTTSALSATPRPWMRPFFRRGQIGVGEDGVGRFNVFTAPRCTVSYVLFAAVIKRLIDEHIKRTDIFYTNPASGHFGSLQT